MQQPIVCQFDAGALECASTPSDRFVQSHYFKALTISPLEESDEREESDEPSQDIDVLRQLLQSEMGYLFFDRMRIRPSGFALGEHVFSLSLAPSEEVVIEQRTFSKRETTLEEQSEQERQIDLELSSTLSTELTEGVERESSKNEQTGFNIGGSVGGKIEGVDVKVDAGYSHNVSEASSQSRQRSVKDSSVATSKVASKYRALHKTTFKVSTEERFEQGAKRVIRNPDRFTPIDLHYFKLLRRLELTQERYAVRLCWAPAVKDPAAEVIGRIELGKKQIIERALAAVDVPLRPAEPPKPQKPPVVAASERKEADKYGLTGDMRADYDLAIAVPNGYLWNGNIDEVAELTQVWGRPSDAMGWNIVGVPFERDGELIVGIHVGANSWLGGPKIFMQAKARFIPVPAEDDPEYKKSFNEWQGKLAQWEADKAARLAGTRKQAEADAEAWARAVIAATEPVIALMDRIAKTHFLGAMSDEPWEVEFWGQVFDWERAGIALYPSWYSSEPARDLRQAPDAFINASWAKLYLPVKPGFERLALRWIVGKVRDSRLDEASEARFAQIASELTAFRKETFGDERETKLGGKGGDELEEQFLTLARWSEAVPTDGTHIEVVQAMTTAVDDLTRTEIDDSRKSLTARVADEEQDIELKKKAIAQFGNKPPNVDVRIATEPGTDFNGH
jgi:hypothetical protein